METSQAMGWNVKGEMNNPSPSKIIHYEHHVICENTDILHSKNSTPPPTRREKKLLKKERTIFPYGNDLVCSLDFDVNSNDMRTRACKLKVVTTHHVKSETIKKKEFQPLNACSLIPG